MLKNKSRIEVIEGVSVNDVKPYPDNPFDHKQNTTNIANSILQFGYSKMSIGVDEENVLLYGHGTLEALKMINWDTIPHVVRVHGLADEEKRAYRIADNTTARRSIIIHSLIKKEMDKQMNFDMGLFGMLEEDILQSEKGETDQTKLADIGKNFADAHGTPKKTGQSNWLYVEFPDVETWQKCKDALTLRGSRELDAKKFTMAVDVYLDSLELPPAKVLQQKETNDEKEKTGQNNSSTQTPGT